MVSNSGLPPVRLRSAESALTALSSDDERQARAAFDYLEREYREYLDHHLRSQWGIADALRADIAQITFLKIWEKRRTFQNNGPVAWRAFLRLIARRVYIDHLRAQGDITPFSEWDTLPDHQRSAAETLLALLATQQVQTLADIALLGLDPALPRDAHARRLLAAQLFYLDQEPWDRVIRLLGPPPRGESPLTREQLDRWLTDPGVLRHLAFQLLYWEPRALADYLLARRRAAGTDEEPADADIPPGLDAALIAWRYQHGLLLEHIASRQDCPLDREALHRFYDRTRQQFPFAGEMQRLTAIFHRHGVRYRPAFLEPDLWQRLAFEYSYRDDLSHRDIQERTLPAAEIVGRDVSLAMLNVWLANRRLLNKVIRTGERILEEDLP